MKKLPDSYVPDRSTKEYPTEIGGQKFSPENISLFKLEKTNKIKNYYTNKFTELSNEYDNLMEDIKVNEMLYSASYNFEPIVGHRYHLYKKSSGNFLSMISPDEWDKFEFIGSFQLSSDGRWSKITF